MEGIYSWVKNIAYYFLFISMISYVLPSNNYKKYIRFFTSMILVILVVTPVFTFLREDVNFDKLFKIESYKEQIASIENAGTGFESLQGQQLLEAYKKEIEVQIEEIIRMNGLYPVLVEAELSQTETGGIDGIEGVTIVAARNEPVSDIMVEPVEIGDGKKDSVEEINIKNDLEDVYNIPVGNINISIQG